MQHLRSPPEAPAASLPPAPMTKIVSSCVSPFSVLRDWYCPVLWQYRTNRREILAREFSSEKGGKPQEYFVYFKVFLTHFWRKRSVRIRRRICAVLPYILYSMAQYRKRKNVQFATIKPLSTNGCSRRSFSTHGFAFSPFCAAPAAGNHFSAAGWASDYSP